MHCHCVGTFMDPMSNNLFFGGASKKIIRQNYFKLKLEKYIKISILTFKSKNFFSRVTKIVLFDAYPICKKRGCTWILPMSQLPSIWHIWHDNHKVEDFKLWLELFSFLCKTLQSLLIVYNYSGFVHWLSS